MPVEQLRVDGTIQSAERGRALPFLGPDDAQFAALRAVRTHPARCAHDWPLRHASLSRRSFACHIYARRPVYRSVSHADRPSCRRQGAVPHPQRPSVRRRACQRRRCRWRRRFLHRLRSQCWNDRWHRRGVRGRRNRRVHSHRRWRCPPPASRDRQRQRRRFAKTVRRRRRGLEPNRPVFAVDAQRASHAEAPERREPIGIRRIDSRPPLRTEGIRSGPMQSRPSPGRSLPGPGVRALSPRTIDANGFPRR